MRGVGVLVLVDQHVAHLRLPFLAHLGVLLQQLERQADQVVEVDALVGGQPLLVARHDAGGDFLVVVLGLGLGPGGIEAHVLPQADRPLPLARARGVGGAAGVLEDAGDVVRIEDGELGLQAQRAAVLPHHPHAERVEGADQDLLRLATHQGLGAFAHFRRGLVGERDGRDAPGLQAGLDQARDLVGDHARLAGTGAGQHQAWALQEIHGLLLGEIETGGHGG